MPDKASALIEMLREALRRVEEDSKACADDLSVVDLKTAMRQGIAALESVKASFDQRQAA